MSCMLMHGCDDFPYHSNSLFLNHQCVGGDSDLNVTITSVSPFMSITFYGKNNGFRPGRCILCMDALAASIIIIDDQ